MVWPGLLLQACGATSDVDMRHRLNTYIIKNPPEDKISKAEKRCASPQQQTSLCAVMILWRPPRSDTHTGTLRNLGRVIRSSVHLTLTHCALDADPLCRLKKQEEERMQEAAGDNLDKEAKVKKDSKKKCVLSEP